MLVYKGKKVPLASLQRSDDETRRFVLTFLVLILLSFAPWKDPSRTIAA